MPLDQLKQLTWIYDLYRLGQDAVALEDASALYHSVLKYIVAGFEAESGSLALLDKNGTSLNIVAGMDLPSGVIGQHVDMGEGVLGWVVQQGKALLLNGDISSDRRFRRHREERGDASLNSAICWPLRIDSRVSGCIAVNRHPDPARPDAKPPFRDADLEQGSALLDMVSLALSNIQLHIEQKRRLDELRALNMQLEQARNHLMQSEKMASIGQLAAGVAHEINNPIGYVYSNLGTLEKYVLNTFSLLGEYEQAEAAIADPVVRASLQAAKGKFDLAFLKEDLPALMAESKEGITRVKKIVQNLKDFSHVDAQDEWTVANLHTGLDSTLNIVHNEIKYKAEVHKEYGDLPDVECLASQMNQVFMNLLVNAAHAIESRGDITIRTGCQGDEVWIDIADTGKGIAPEHLNRIFDPFFTTKPVGKGTGLGLSLSYGIVHKHHGRIEVQSEVGKGTTFRVWLPIRQSGAERATA
jgi:two-component system, NtrC family, sensor kinase